MHGMGHIYINSVIIQLTVMHKHEPIIPNVKRTDEINKIELANVRKSQCFFDCQLSVPPNKNI